MPQGNKLFYLLNLSNGQPSTRAALFIDETITRFSRPYKLCQAFGVPLKQDKKSVFRALCAYQLMGGLTPFQPLYSF